MPIDYCLDFAKKIVYILSINFVKFCEVVGNQDRLSLFTCGIG
jgi:hypothetical protein